ncbi:hypothetical protein LEMLEM_LOCUS27413 [Lemmus lemmus]
MCHHKQMWQSLKQSLAHRPLTCSILCAGIITSSLMRKRKPALWKTPQEVQRQMLKMATTLISLGQMRRRKAKKQRGSEKNALHSMNQRKLKSLQLLPSLPSY